MNKRIAKKKHTLYLGEFLIEVSQDKVWIEKLKSLDSEAKLDTAVEGMPAGFIANFPEVEAMNLQYSLEPVDVSEVPRAASCWWEVDKTTRCYLAYPSDFPRTKLYMAVDFELEAESGCCHG